ncbi:uroporphyrinogen-III synthase [Pseudomonas sp. DC3000-4b1]|uniref:uroporphyrinogen-III synthase n=1 Tax=unclassified Pseudomonas TaxID=196821 RepID=UPI003CF97C81
MMAWRLLLTRPATEGRPVAEALAEQGYYGALMPMLEIQPLTPLPVLKGQAWQALDAVIVVSKPAARLCLQGLPPREQRVGLQWFAVGPATAAILREAGLDAHYSAQGDDSEALLRLPALAAVLARPCPRILIIRGEGGRDWLAHRLGERGAQVGYLELYRRGVPDYAANAVAQRLQAERLNGVVVSSGQGLEHLHRLAGSAWPALAAMPLFVPSARVAGLAHGLGCHRPINCEGASTAALVAALAVHSP